MPRNPPTLYIYPLENYEIGMKGPLLEKDSSVKQRMERMEKLYKQFGLRRVVEGLLILHYKGHPHVLVLQIGNTFFKLPGGRLRMNEEEVSGLQRKLDNKLGTPNQSWWAASLDRQTFRNQGRTRFQPCGNSESH